ncbi:MAG: hypothetical protein AUI86_02005 [Gemmatimonadetes bacterium 13_1_40CM_3_66_12]|nr:MAG: hypothetical protein AUI86_02005 [Gemmatimonadetes bacterium 13_1_40CM_3_66_12]
MTMKSISDYVHWKANTPAQQQKPFHAACYAPFVSILFDTKGYVRSCCQSLTHSIGNITKQSLKEIWRGEVNQWMRRRMMADDLPEGCATCKWDIERGNFAQVFAGQFDHFSVAAEQPDWPINMWFLLSNSCNLECVQCYGELSSSIRKNRDRLPPLRGVYHDAFFEELREFLPHLKLALFLGGEAFLARENYRIWDMMIDDNLRTSSHIVTNGTIFNERVKRVVSSLPCSVSISLDGATQQTVESIRRNSRFEDTMINIKKFQEHATVGLSFCLMPQNQHEFADFLFLAEQLGCDASANTVFHPAQYSLCALPTDELARVVKAWENRSPEVLQRLQVDRHRELWACELSRLQHWVECPEGPPTGMYLTGISPRMDLGLGSRTAPIVVDHPSAVSVGKRIASETRGVDELGEAARLGVAREVLAKWSGHIRMDQAVLDEHDVVSCDGGVFGGLESGIVNGRPLSVLLMLLRERYGEDVSILSEECTSAEMDRTMEFTNLREEKTQLRWKVLSPADRASRTKRFLLAVRDHTG